MKNAAAISKWLDLNTQERIKHLVTTKEDDDCLRPTHGTAVSPFRGWRRLLGQAGRRALSACHEYAGTKSESETFLE